MTDPGSPEGVPDAAAVACIGTWITDFRDDLPKIDLPCWSSRRRGPGAAAGQDRQPPARLIKDMHLVVVPTLTRPARAQATSAKGKQKHAQHRCRLRRRSPWNTSSS